LPLLREDSQTCKVLPSASSASLPLLPSRDDGKHVDGFRVEVEFPKSMARLTLDSGASGLFILKAIAEQNGFTLPGMQFANYKHEPKRAARHGG
jgi:hypothetical protein